MLRLCLKFEFDLNIDILHFHAVEHLIWFCVVMAVACSVSGWSRDYLVEWKQDWPYNCE